MKMTRERKIYLAMLVTGLAALVLDRLTAGPQNARAQDDPSSFVVERTDKSLSSGAPTVTGGAEHTAIGPDLSVRLRSLGERFAVDSQYRDPFRAPSSWAPRSAAVPLPATVPVSDPASPAGEFERSHRLTAVLLSDRQRNAVVDGKMIKPGQAIDGFTLISVTHDTAVFRAGAATAVLRTEVKAP
jgi:hypothetical protein